VQPWRNTGQEQYYFTAYESALQFIEQIDSEKLRLPVDEYQLLFSQHYQQAKARLNYEPPPSLCSEVLALDVKKQNLFLLKWVNEFGKEFQQAFSENSLKNISFYQKDLEFAFKVSEIKISELSKFHGEYQMLVQKLQYFQKKLDAIQLMAGGENRDRSVKEKLFGLLRFN